MRGSQSLQAFSLIGLDPTSSIEERIGTSTVQLETGTTGNAGLIGSSSLSDTKETDEDATTLSEDEVVKVTRKDLSDKGGTMVESRAVLTKQDLKAFAESELYSDDSLESIKFKEDSVELRYKQDGLFLALVSVPMTVRAEAKANGDTTLDYPWYSLLTVDHSSEIQTEMKIAVQNALYARTVGSVQSAGDSKHPKFSVNEAADVADHIHKALKSKL